jgi:hypothetical protein
MKDKKEIEKKKQNTRRRKKGEKGDVMNKKQLTE